MRNDYYKIHVDYYFEQQQQQGMMIRRIHVLLQHPQVARVGWLQFLGRHRPLQQQQAELAHPLLALSYQRRRRAVLHR